MKRVKDPVCGKEFDLHETQAYEDYRGWAYFFCSEGCHGRFCFAAELLCLRSG